MDTSPLNTPDPSTPSRTSRNEKVLDEIDKQLDAWGAPKMVDEKEKSVAAAAIMKSARGDFLELAKALAFFIPAFVAVNYVTDSPAAHKWATGVGATVLLVAAWLVFKEGSETDAAAAVLEYRCK